MARAAMARAAAAARPPEPPERENFVSYKDWREGFLAQSWLYGRKEGLDPLEIDSQIRAISSNELRALYDAEKAAAYDHAKAGYEAKRAAYEAENAQRCPESPTEQAGGIGFEQAELLTKSQLLKRGWADTLATRFLGEPDQVKPDPTSNTTMKLYKLERIAQAEATDQFRSAYTAMHNPPRRGRR
jgi:hypothetical protein